MTSKSAHAPSGASRFQSFREEKKNGTWAPAKLIISALISYGLGSSLVTLSSYLGRPLETSPVVEYFRRKYYKWAYGTYINAAWLHRSTKTIGTSEEPSSPVPMYDLDPAFNGPMQPVRGQRYFGVLTKLLHAAAAARRRASFLLLFFDPLETLLLLQEHACRQFEGRSKAHHADSRHLGARSGEAATDAEGIVGNGDHERSSPFGMGPLKFFGSPLPFLQTWSRRVPLLLSAAPVITIKRRKDPNRTP